MQGIGKRFLLTIPLVVLAVHIGLLESESAYRQMRTRTLLWSAWFQDWLGLTPPWPSQVKVIAYDDQATSLTRRPALSGTEWAGIIELINARRPRVILIDKLFQLNEFANGSEQQGLAAAMRAAGNVWTAVNLVDSPLPYTPALLPSQLSARQVFPLQDWAKGRGRLAYGADSGIASAVRGMGHIVYASGGHVRPAEPLRDSSLMIGHLALAVARKSGMPSGRISVDGRPLPLDRHGYVPLRLNHKRLLQNTRTMAGVLERLAKAAPVNYIQEDDVVLLLPAVFTGNADVDETLYNGLPKGLVVASFAASAAAGDWIRYDRTSYVTLWSVIVISVLWALHAGKWHWLAGQLALSGLLIIGPLLAYALASLDSDWMIYSTASASAAVLVRLLKLSEDLSRVKVTVETLSSAVPPRLKEDLLTNPDLLRRTPSEKTVTLMFVDIVNFSIFAETRPPSEVFARLKEKIRDMTQQVVDHGGIVDRTLGDGFLAIFGYDFTGRAMSDNHADAAIRCGIEIQKRNQLDCIAASRDGQLPALPLRIGINTANVYLGDLDGEHKFDFTVIGHGVNFTQRLENACEPGTLLVSLSTFHAATETDILQKSAFRRMIKIKHHSELVEVMHCDPLSQDPETKRTFQQALRTSHCIQRGEERHAVPANADIRGSGAETGEFRITDYSESGLCIQAGSFLARGIKVRIQVTASGLNFGQDIVIETCWGYPLDSTTFVHGVRYVGMPASVQKRLFAFLHIVASDSADIAA